jgi:hypothetical protein
MPSTLWRADLMSEETKAIFLNEVEPILEPIRLEGVARDKATRKE